MKVKKYAEIFFLGMIVMTFLAGFYYRDKEEQNQDRVKQELLLKKKEEIERYVSRMENQPLKDTLLISENGDPHRLNDFQNKPKVLVFWASWCPDCQQELPVFQSLFKKYGHEVDFFMINLQDGKNETEDSSKKILKENSFTFPVYVDKDFRLSKKFEIQAIPTVLLVNSNGVVSKVFVERSDEATLSKSVKRLLDNEN